MTLKNAGWRQGYHVLFGIQLAIAAIILLSFPIWKKIEEKEPVEEEMEILSIKQILSLRGAPWSLLVYLGSCGIEAIILGYGSTFLTQSHSLTPATAAAIITYYYLGMTLGRALSGLISKKFRSEQILIMGEAITCAAVLLLLVSGTPFLAGFGLFLVGLGNGPIFPNMTHLAPIHYGKSKSQAFIGLQGGGSYASFMMLPVITGQLIQRLGSGTFPWILTVTMVLTVVATLSTLQIHSTKSYKE